MRLYFSWVLFFYGVLIAPVLLISWCFSEPFFLSLLWRSLMLGLGLFIVLLMLGLIAHRSHRFSSGYHYFLLVMFWFGASLLSACFFMLYPLDLSWVDAFFAGVSGLTTTGTEVFKDLTLLPKSLLFYRMWLQFLGGLGIILMAVTAFSSGGFEVLRGVKFDLPGPVVSYSEKKPKMSDMAQYLWLIYAGSTLLCVLSMKSLGLDWFESVCESFSVLSTGGYGLYNEGVAHYQSQGVKVLMMLFMLFSSVNFLLHYQFFILREAGGYLRNYEFRGYLMQLSMVTVIVFFTFYYVRDVGAGVDGFFMVVSLLSSSGFAVTDIQAWPSFLPHLMIWIGLIGGCAGSTSGGVKMIRLQFCCQEVFRACRLMIHPRVVLSDPAVSVGMSGSSVDSQIVIMRGFIMAFLAYFILSIFVLTGLGLTFQNAFFSICACLSNTGLILTLPQGAVGLSDAVKLWLSLTMLFGRIEILAFLVMFSPQYWMEG